MENQSKINVTSKKIQKTEDVTVKIKCDDYNGNKYLYFEGKDLIGYIFLPQEIIEKLKQY